MEGGSAGPQEAGPGTGVARGATQLTDEAQKLANSGVDALERGLEAIRGFANHAFDGGEGALGDVLAIADEIGTLAARLVKEASDLSTTAVSQVRGKLGGST